MLQATAANVAAWSTDVTGLTSLTVDNIAIDGNTILCTTGTIDFGDENLTTIGWFVASNIPRPIVTDKVLTSTGVDTATWQTPTADHGNLTGLTDDDHPQYVTYTGATGTVDLGSQILTTTGTVVGSNIPAPIVTAKVLTSTGANTATWQDPDHGTLVGLADDDHPQYTKKTGWSANYPAGGLTTTTVNSGTREVSIAPTGASFEFWIQGVKYTKTTTQTVQITDTEGIWFIYFNSSGVLTASQTVWDIHANNWAGVCIVYWDAINNIFLLNGPEQHSFEMDASTHYYLHYTFGARWSEGLTVSISGDNLDVTSGKIHDEDIEIWIKDVPGGGSNIWEQDLTPANLPIFYRSGTSDWRLAAPSTTPVYIDTNIPQINTETGSVWSWENAGVNQYFAYWVIASNDQDTPVVLVPGQESSGTLTGAQDGNQLADMNFGDLPVVEAKVIARVIMQRQVTSPYYNIQEVDDYRNVVDEPSGGGSIVGDHGNLTGLGDDDHPQYLKYTGATANLDMGTYTVTTTGTVVGSNIPAPTVASKVLTSTGVGTATWQDPNPGVTDHGALTGLTDDDHPQYVTYTGATGTVNLGAQALTTTSTVVGSNIPAPTLANQVLQCTSANNASWSTDVTGLTSLIVDNITINGAVISSDTGSISFSDENLSTTGTLGCGAFTASSTTQTYATMYTDGSATGYSGLYSYEGGASVTGTCVIDLPNGFQDTLMALRILGYNYTSSGGWGLIIGGYPYTGTGKWLQHHASIQGNPPFTDVRLGWNGNTSKACIMLGTTSSSWSYPTIHLESMVAGLLAETSYQSGWAINFYTSETNFVSQPGYFDPVTVEVYRDLKSPTASGQIPVANSVGGDVTWTTSLTTLTNLTVDNINIDGAVITSDTGAISFSNENLTTTGTVVGTNIPSPTLDNQALTSTASGNASWNTTSLADVLASEVPSASGAERKFVLTSTGGQFEYESAPWPLTLTENETVYIRTTGNDTTGDGSIIYPFLTLTRTIEYLGGLYIGDYTVTVDIGEGVFTEAGTLTFLHPFGSQVTFTGVSEQITSQNTNSISASGTSLGHSNLYRYDVTFILPVGKSVSVGDYIAVREVSGGTNPEALYGCHYVSGWVSGSRTATVQVVYRNGAPKASGTVTCTIELIKTVVAFSNKNGLKITGPNDGGVWKGLVLQGDYNTTNTSAKYGVWSLNTGVVAIGGSSSSGWAIGVVGFQTGMYAQNNALVFGDYSFVSKCGTRCCNAQNGGILNLRYTRLSGANNNGLFAFNGSTVAANSMKVVAVGDESVLSYQGSFIDAQSSYVDQNNATYSFKADRWSGIDATSASESDGVSPVTDGNNDGSYIIGL
jgi:hypothetical protein